MKEELQRSVIDAIGHPASAASVSLATTATGIGAYLELISKPLGVIATLSGIILSCTLAYKAILDAKLKRIQIEKLEAE